jgi:hypothetical protein
MRAFLPKPISFVLVSFLGVLVLAAFAALSPFNRHDLQSNWNPSFFISTALGPLSAFFAWPDPSQSDLVFSVFAALALFSSAVWFVRRPSKPAAGLFIGLTAFWLLLGLGITYAWI